MYINKKINNKDTLDMPIQIKKNVYTHVFIYHY